MTKNPTVLRAVSDLADAADKLLQAVQQEAQKLAREKGLDRMLFEPDGNQFRLKSERVILSHVPAIDDVVRAYTDWFDDFRWRWTTDRGWEGL